VTETLASWNCAPIACTRFCERPDLEHVGGTKDPDVQRVVALRPDLVVLDAEQNRLEDYEAMVARGLTVHVLRVRSLGDLNTAMIALATVVGARWEQLEVGVSAPTRFRAFIPIWRRPWMALGVPTYGSSLLAHLGVANIFSGDEPYPSCDLDDARALGPDVVLAPSEPYPFSSRQRDELERVAPVVFLDGKDLFWWGVRTHGALTRLARELVTVTSP
jgi:ABC-type Fe3+-hydroxamate transport system substrate-binding protein